MWLDVFNEVVKKVSEFGFVLVENNGVGKCCFAAPESCDYFARVYLTLFSADINNGNIIRVTRNVPSNAFLDVDLYKHDSVQSMSFRVMSAMCILFDFNLAEHDEVIQRGILDLMLGLEKSGMSCLGTKLMAGGSCTFGDISIKYEDGSYSDIVVSCKDHSKVIATVFTDYEEPYVMVMFTREDGDIFLDISVNYMDKVEHFTYDSTLTRL